MNPFPNFRATRTVINKSLLLEIYSMYKVRHLKIIMNIIWEMKC